MITIVTSITNPDIFRNNLRIGLDIQDTPYKIVITESTIPLWTSYNMITPDTKYVMFVSQDIMFCSKDFLRRIEEYADSLPDVGVIGITGWIKDKRSPLGYWIQYHPVYGNSNIEQKYGDMTVKGKTLGQRFDTPLEVQVLDGMLLMVSTDLWKKYRFDDNTFKFHGGAWDYCLTIKYIAGRKNYIVPLKFFEDCSSYYPSNILRFKEEKRAIDDLLNKWKGKIDRIGGHIL